jgi:hypothetical protein
MDTKKQIIGTLKNIKTVSKIDDNGREVHHVTTTIELLENGGREHIHDIARSLNKPIRVDFDAVQLELIK